MAKQKQKEPLQGQQLVDEFVKHQVYLGQYANGFSKEITALFSDFDILNTIEKGTIKQIKSLVEKRLNKYRKEVATRTGKSFKELTKIELDWITSILLLKSNRVATSDEIIENALDYPLIQQNITPSKVLISTFDRLQEQITNTSLSLQAGTITQGEANLFLKAAFIQFKNNLDAGIKTSVYSLASQAREAAYMQNSDIIQGVIMCAVLDGRTTNYCKSIDGTFFKLGEGPRPPFHIRCRTIAISVNTSQTKEQAQQMLQDRVRVGAGEEYTKGDNKAKTTRKNVKDGVIDIKEGGKTSLSYGNFLKSQINTLEGKAFIYDVIGVTRGNLFIKTIKNGGNAQDILKEVLTKDLKTLDLKELRKRSIK